MVSIVKKHYEMQVKALKQFGNSSTILIQCFRQFQQKLKIICTVLFENFLFRQTEKEDFTGLIRYRGGGGLSYHFKSKNTASYKTVLKDIPLTKRPPSLFFLKVSLLYRYFQSSCSNKTRTNIHQQQSLLQHYRQTDGQNIYRIDAHL